MSFISKFLNLLLVEVECAKKGVIENIQSQKEYSANSRIHSLCPTRWTIRTGAIQAILNNYESLLMTMDATSYGNDDCSRRADDVLAIMASYFGLIKLLF